MKEIILNPPKSNAIELIDVDENKPIFVKKDNRLVGMIVHEFVGWAIHLGWGIGSIGHYNELKNCLRAGKNQGYTYHIEEEE